MRDRELVLLGSPIKCNTAVHLFKDAGPGVTAQRASRGQPVPSPQQVKCTVSHLSHIKPGQHPT